MKEANKDEAFKEVLGDIRKTYGADAIQEMSGESAKNLNVEFVPTSSLALNRILGGGLPRGRVIEVYGLPSSGKSVLSLFLMAKIQKNNGRAVLIDSEFSFNPVFAEKIGVDVNKMILVQPTTGEEGLGIVEKLVSKSAVDIIVVDSVASLVPQAELEGKITDQSVALQARMLSKALRMLTGAISKSKTIVLFINQIREKVGVFYGPKTVTPGGNALKFYSSIRLEVVKGKNIVDDKNVAVGNWMKIRVVKNKVAPPFKECEIELLYEQGVDLFGEVIEEGTRAGAIERKGNTYYFGEEKLEVGYEKTKEFLKNNPQIRKNIVKKISN